MTLSLTTKHILNDPRLIAIRDAHFARLERVFDAADEPAFYLSGINGRSEITIYDEPEHHLITCLEDLAQIAEEAGDADVFRPLCFECDIYGVHYVDSIFGCHVYHKHGQWYNEHVDNAVGALPAPDIDASLAWQLTERVTRAFVAADVALPIFGLPTIASALNIAVNLYGEDILTALLCDPEAAARDLQTINDVLMELHRRLMNLIPAAQLQAVIPAGRVQPLGSGQICGCTTQLLSPACYREMVAPLDDALLGVYPRGGMIHLCGAHEQHIATFHDMKNLRALQLNDRAAEGLAAYHVGLRPDQVIYLNPCEGMSAEQGMNLTQGRGLVLVS